MSAENIENLFIELKRVPRLTKILVTGNDFVPIKHSEEDFLDEFTNKEHVVEMLIGYIVGESIVTTTGPRMDV